MYARIEGDQIAEYPLTEHEIKERFPSTSFTTNFSGCLPDGYICVRPGSPPIEDDMKITTEAALALSALVGAGRKKPRAKKGKKKNLNSPTQ